MKEITINDVPYKPRTLDDYGWIKKVKVDEILNLAYAIINKALNNDGWTVLLSLILTIDQNALFFGANEPFSLTPFIYMLE